MLPEVRQPISTILPREGAGRTWIDLIETSGAPMGLRRSLCPLFATITLSYRPCYRLGPDLHLILTSERVFDGLYELETHYSQVASPSRDVMNACSSCWMNGGHSRKRYMSDCEPCRHSGKPSTFHGR